MTSNIPANRVQQFELNVGSNRGNPRIWIERPELKRFGFSRHASTIRNIVDGKIVIEIERHVGMTGKRGKVHGKANKPLIDLSGAWLKKVGFETGARVRILITYSMLTITLI